MMDYIPNIHLFSLYNQYYFYDANTNAIMELPSEIYGFLKDITEKKSVDVRKEFESLNNHQKEEIEYLISSGLLSKNVTDCSLCHPETEMLGDYYKSNLSSITLQVTQNCNLRCAYCIYSGSYVNRTHNNKRMQLETAIKAVDFLYRHSSQSHIISIGFYGGEPLLEFDLIQKVVDYAEGLFKGKSLQFLMTTNATLLSVEKARYLREHKFHLTISLDGPQSIHNKNRIFAGSNKGSFQVIMNNLKKIKEDDPQALKDISFNAVIDMNQDTSCSNEFFLHYDLVKEMDVGGNYVDSSNKKDQAPSAPPQFYIDTYYELFKLYLFQCTDIFSAYAPKLYSFEISAMKRNMLERTVLHNACTTPGGQCLPGIQRFFVDVDGLFYPCERVNESANDFVIGDIENGFDVEKAKKLLNVALITENECKNCWCSKLCNQCISKAEENGKLSRKMRLSNCQDTKIAVEDMMKNYIVLRKHGCRFEEYERKDL